MRQSLKFIAILTLWAVSLAPCPAKAQHGALFIENKGQWPGDVKFLYRTGGLNLWITKNGVVYDLHKDEYATPPLDSNSGNLAMLSFRERRLPRPVKRTGHVVSMSFSNENSAASAIGDGQQPGIFNYFIGNDSTKWTTNVHSYSNALLQNLYEGIDARFYVDNGRPRYDILINPGADPSNIAMNFKGADMLCVSDSILSLQTSVGELDQCGLFAYQEINGRKQKVACRFRMSENGSVGFDIGTYDRTLPLTIDPLIYSTFLGGIGIDEAFGIAVDSAGDAFIAGWTLEGDFPVTNGAYQTVVTGGYGYGFISKLNPSGTTLIYSTYVSGTLGGSTFTGVAIDSSGNAYVTGETGGTGLGAGNYPTTAGAFLSGNLQDSVVVVVSKLNSLGTKLLYSTFVGKTDNVNNGGTSGIAVDMFGDAYITGMTAIVPFSTYPVTPGAFQDIVFNGQDIYVTKLNPTGTALIYSSLFGGSSSSYNDSRNIAKGIALDSIGEAFVTGYSWSSDFPTTTGVFQKGADSGFYRTFITKLNTAGSGLIYSTMLGGTASDEASGIAVNRAGNAFVTGVAMSHDFPVTPGAYQTKHGGVDSSYNFNVFVSELNDSGTGLIYSTFIGGDSEDAAEAISIDSAGDAYITGFTRSSGTYPVGYPTTPNAYQQGNNGSADVFLSELNASGSNLLYSTLIGGAGFDVGSAVAIDHSGNVYLAGTTNSAGIYPTGYPTTSGAIQPANGGSSDAFVTKFGPLSGAVELEIDSFDTPTCSNSVTTLHFKNIAGSTVTLDSASADAPFSVSSHFPVTVAVQDSTQLSARILSQTEGSYQGEIHLYYHTANQPFLIDSISTQATVLPSIQLSVAAWPVTSATDRFSVDMPIYLYGTIDAATSASLGIQTITVKLALNTDLLTMLSVENAIPGAVVSPVDVAAQSFTITLPAGFTFTDSVLLATAQMRSYITDTLQTRIILNIYDSTSIEYPCFTSSINYLAQYSLDTLCGDQLISDALAGDLAISILSINPNPTTGEIQIILAKSSPSLAVDYEVLDLLGATIQSGTLASNNLDLRGLPSGSYYLRLSAGGFVETRNVIVSR